MTDKRLKPPGTIIALALNHVIAKLIAVPIEWPEDIWIRLSDEYDLNLWLEDIAPKTRTYKATIYPIIEGSTNTDTFITIFSFTYDVTQPISDPSGTKREWDFGF